MEAMSTWKYVGVRILVMCPAAGPGVSSSEVCFY